LDEKSFEFANRSELSDSVEGDPQQQMQAILKIRSKETKGIRESVKKPKKSARN